MPKGVYDRSLAKRAHEHIDCASRAARKTPQKGGGVQEHQKNALELAVRDAISESIARARAAIVSELKVRQ